jgi:hypothetical protein
MNIMQITLAVCMIITAQAFAFLWGYMCGCDCTIYKEVEPLRKLYEELRNKK